jgi:uncharacterized protein (DUF362 family)
MSEQPTVALARVSKGLEEAVAQVLEAVVPREAVVRGAKVLIKPNFHGGSGYTSLAVVEALVRWAQAAGAAAVVVGEGPYFGLADVSGYFSQIGASELCRKLGVPLVCFHDGDYTLLSPGQPALPPTVGVTKWLAWADLVVNAPVMKTHFNTLTTLAMKNLKGFLRPADKRALHERDLHLALAALAQLIRPHVHLLDGTTAYEGMGPSAATPVNYGLVLASADAMALDTVANWLMGFAPAQVRYLREAERLGLGRLPARSEEVAALTNVPLAELTALRRPFVPPYAAAQADYPRLELSTHLACSGCLMNLFTALRELQQLGRAAELTGRVAIGKAPGQVDLAVGNCTYAAWETAPHVRGCPPTIEAIKQALQEHLQGRGASG